MLAYARTVVSLTNGKIHDSTDAMNAYLLVESYFLTVINYQLQATTVMVNACNLLDPTGILGYDTSFLNSDVIPKITAEVGVFISAVDYLVANIGDYRNQARFISDMQYANAGLAPDKIFLNVLARSQFIANLLYDAMGLSYPVMCGHILTPYNYGNNPTGLLSVTIGSRTITAIPDQILSQLPYTYWDNTTCHPDQTWNSYRYGTHGIPDPGWSTGNQPLVISNAGGQTPWVHYGPVKGSITPLYYNPKNPNQTSITQTTECTIEFAYFSANWQWGYLLLSNSSTQSGWKKTSDGGAFDFENFNSSLVGSTLGVPFAASGKGKDLSYQPGVQYYYQTANLASTVPASISFNQAYQFVYGGLYNVP